MPQASWNSDRALQAGEGPGKSSETGDRQLADRFSCSVGPASSLALPCTWSLSPQRSGTGGTRSPKTAGPIARCEMPSASLVL